MLKLIRQWLQAGVMEEGRVTATVAGTPQGGVISPLLSNIYLHVLDDVWTRRSPQLGTLVRYADDFVVLCDTKLACERAEQRVREILARLGLDLHPDKTRRVDLSWGREGFDFLGCHLRKRLSGRIWEQQRKRVDFLQRWPSRRAMQRVRARVKALTPRGACHRPLRETLAQLNSVLRGWGGYFRTGNAAIKFGQVDAYVDGAPAAPARQALGSPLATWAGCPVDAGLLPCPRALPPARCAQDRWRRRPAAPSAQRRAVASCPARGRPRPFRPRRVGR